MDTHLARLRAKHGAELEKQRHETALLEAQLAQRQQTKLSNLMAQHAAAEETLRNSYKDQVATTYAGRLLLETPDDVALAISCHIDSAKDLLRLSIASRRYRRKTMPDPHHDKDRASRPREVWSIVSEAARRQLAACSEEERRRVPRRPQDCWLSLLHELLQLRAPLTFANARKGKGYSLSPNARLQVRADGPDVTRITGTTHRHVVASKIVMRSGTHRARFSVRGSAEMFFGVISADFDAVSNSSKNDPLKIMRNPFTARGHCFYSTSNGRWVGNAASWKGMQGAKDGDTITLELDIETTTLSVWKNDLRLGQMAKGFNLSTRCEYCWAVWLGGVFCADRSAVRIDHASHTLGEAERPSDS